MSSKSNIKEYITNIDSLVKNPPPLYFSNILDWVVKYISVEEVYCDKRAKHTKKKEMDRGPIKKEGQLDTHMGRVPDQEGWPDPLKEPNRIHSPEFS